MHTPPAATDRLALFKAATERLLTAGARRSVQCVLAGVYLLYVLYHTTKFRVSEIWPLRPHGDAAIMFDKSQHVVDAGHYPAQFSLGNFHELFPYPPPAVLMLNALTTVGPRLFAAVWLVLTTAAFVFSIKASLAGEPKIRRAAWLLIGLLGLLIADSPISWDLRNENSNLIYLSIVMLAYATLAQRPLLAGCCVGVSIALKLYSGLLLVWLLIFRPKAAFAGIAMTVLLWVVWPVVTFGFSGAVTVYEGWREQVRIVADPAVYTALTSTGAGPPVTTVRRAVMALTGGSVEATGTRLISGTLLCAWTGLLLWYGARAFSAGVSPLPSRAVLADWVVLLVAPLPFSPWLEPYHAVAMLPAALLLVAVTLDVSAAGGHRMVAVLALVAAVLVRETMDTFAVRGISLLAQFVLLVTAISLMRGSFGRESKTAVVAD